MKAGRPPEAPGWISVQRCAVGIEISDSRHGETRDPRLSVFILRAVQHAVRGSKKGRELEEHLEKAPFPEGCWLS